MTRVLSELLGAREPHFRTALRQLEQAAGLPAADIRLTADINLQTKDKLRELGLDRHDTTGRELYFTLQERVRRDNATLVRMLGGTVGGSNLMPRIERLVNEMDVPKQVFALKNACAKRLLKANPPKRVMKQLGYRSVDSLLKHESPAVLFAAARVAESAAWHRSMTNTYRKLLPGDFETRAVLVTAPANERWERFARPYVEKQQHNVLSIRELGAVVLLPLSGRLVEGSPLAATLLTLQALAGMRSGSTYLKLHQVRPDFGALVARLSTREPAAESRLAGIPLPWKLIHDFYARHPQAYRPELFEPHVQADDLCEEPLEQSLAKLHPTFEFWRQAGHLGLNHSGDTVSLHPLDAVLNFCNRRPYEQRLVRRLRHNLWHELLLRYMRQEPLLDGLQRQLGDELVGPAALV